MDVVSWALSGASYSSEKPIFIDAADPSLYVTSAGARSLIRQLIAGLRAAGLSEGDAVCILTLSNIYYPIFFLAIIGAGGRVVGGNPGHTVYELKHLVEQCSVTFILTEPNLVDKADAVAHETAMSPDRVFLYDGPPGKFDNARSWRSLLQHGEQDWRTLTEAEAAVTVAAYYSTSGTTGAPKFAAVSHAYQTFTGHYIQSETQAKPYPVSRLVSLPLMHAFAAPLVHIAALRTGTPTFILPRFNATAFISAIEEHMITEVPLVPSMLIALLASPLCTAQSVRSLREVMCAGAPLSTPLASSFSALLTAPSARLIQLYGATEASWIASIPFGMETKSSQGSASVVATEFSSSAFKVSVGPTPTVGIPVSGIEIRLTSISTGEVVADSLTPSALEVRSPHSFMYYTGAAEATRDSFTVDGWLRTGDIAVRDENGMYYIVDRQKDMIKVRGWQVAPSEIEACLSEHPAVDDCAVLGVEDTRGASGEIPLAFVALKSGFKGNEGHEGNDETPVDQDLAREAQMKAFLRRRLAEYKIPQTIMTVPRIPRNPAGKILRRVLRAEQTACSAYADSGPACRLKNKGDPGPADRHAANEIIT